MNNVLSFILRATIDANFNVFEKKPWRNPGMDVNDFFNFGFNEQSWRDYWNPLVSKHVLILDGIFFVERTCLF